MAEASRPETTGSSSEQLMLASCHVDLFDFVLIHDVVDGLLGDDDQLSDGVSAAAAVPHSEGELEVDPGNTSIVAKGLIDPAAGWHVDDEWVDPKPVSWVPPGPRGSPFAAFDRREFLDREWPTAERVPVLIKLVPDDDAAIRRFMEDARQDGWTENLTDSVWGWVELRDSRWHGKVQDAFPSLVDAEAVASLDHPGHHMNLDGVLLPFVLELEERSRLSLNADALGRIVLVFPYRQYRTIRNQIVGGARTGYWSGELAFRHGDYPAVVRETHTLQLHTGGPGEAVEHMRADWELGAVFREARQAWLHRLPPCPQARWRWRLSQLHSALRRMLPGLAAQGRGEGWTEKQRTEMMDEVLSIVLMCRFGFLKVPVFDGGRLRDAREGIYCCRRGRRPLP